MWRHKWQTQVIQTLAGKREADQAAPVRSHEIDNLRSDFFSGNSQVAFVLPILIVDHDQDTARTDLFNSFGDRDE